MRLSVSLLIQKVSFFSVRGFLQITDMLCPMLRRLLEILAQRLPPMALLGGKSQQTMSMFVVVLCKAV